MKRIDGESRSNVKTQSSDINKRKDFGKRSKTEEKANKGKGIQCYECEGFGHIKAECPTFLKKEKKGLSTSWSEDDSSSEGESAKKVSALTRAYDSDEESDGDELTFDELVDSFKELSLRST